METSSIAAADEYRHHEEDIVTEKLIKRPNALAGVCIAVIRGRWRITVSPLIDSG